MLKRLLKALGIFLLIFLVLVGGLMTVMALMPAAPRRYTAKTETGGILEERYLQQGGQEVRKATFEAEGDLEKFTVWYPSAMEENDDVYPAVIMVNGTGVKASKYNSVLKHLATWGFIVIGNEHPSSGFGESTDQTLDFLMAQNEDQDSLFYQKIDLDRIGLEGHSQGGAGCFTELSVSPYKDAYKTAVALSPTDEELANAFGWNYDTTKIDAPVLMIAGSENDVITLENMEKIFDRLQGPKAMMRRTGADHGKMLYQADGYATAWLMWQLQNDEEAAAAFTGEDPELMNNTLYQDQRMEIRG